MKGCDVARPEWRRTGFMDDLLNEFLMDAGASANAVDQQRVRFEQEPTNGGTLSNTFRLLLSSRGTFGFNGLMLRASSEVLRLISGCATSIRSISIWRWNWPRNGRVIA